MYSQFNVMAVQDARIKLILYPVINLFTSELIWVDNCGHLSSLLANSVHVSIKEILTHSSNVLS